MDEGDMVAALSNLIGQDLTAPVDKTAEQPTFSVEKLMAALQITGEVMYAEELQQYLSALLEDHPRFKGKVPAEFTVQEFITEVLGFKAVEAA